MLFESFNITFSYRDLACEVEIRERYDAPLARTFEVIQGGIAILLLTYKQGEWDMKITEGLHPVVKQDTEEFVGQELKHLLVQSIRAHYQLFTDRKINSQGN